MSKHFKEMEEKNMLWKWLMKKAMVEEDEEKFLSEEAEDRVEAGVA